MRVIDADSHFIEPLDWIQQADPELAAEVPDALSVSEFAEVIFGELLATLPDDQRPALRELLAPKLGALAGQPGGAGRTSVSDAERKIKAGPLARSLRPLGAHDADERLRFCDERGIDIQLISPTAALGNIVLVSRSQPHLKLRLIQAYNTWAATTLSAHIDRLIPVTMIDLEDVRWAVGELERMRAAGSRAFLFPLNPIAGRSLGDPAYDPIWDAALTLGMIPLMHVGFGRVEIDPSWASIGGTVVAKNLARISMAQTAVIPQLALASMIYGGVFDRYPDLTVVCQEFGLWWIEHWVDKVGPISRDGGRNSGAAFGWELRCLPVDYLQRNIRFSPLYGQRVDRLIEALGPDIVVFASDYPHPEGSEDAKQHFDEQLAGPQFDADTRSKFFGGTMEQLLAKGR
jgi:predicted TIM-barrel fold metal-dependent hydrolase